METKRTVETTLRVRYAETDASGIVYNANYLVWFEVARGEFFWQKGRDYHRDVEAHGFNWPVTEAGLRYLASAHYGELVTVTAWVDELQSRSLKIGYEVRNTETNQVLCTGFTKHLNIDLRGHVRVLPPEIRALLIDDESGEQIQPSSSK